MHLAAEPTEYSPPCSLSSSSPLDPPVKGALTFPRLAQEHFLVPHSRPSLAVPISGCRPSLCLHFFPANSRDFPSRIFPCFLNPSLHREVSFCLRYGNIRSAHRLPCVTWAPRLWPGGTSGLLFGSDERWGRGWGRGLGVDGQTDNLLCKILAAPQIIANCHTSGSD